jgi:hypothetical protein
MADHRQAGTWLSQFAALVSRQLLRNSLPTDIFCFAEKSSLPPVPFASQAGT